MKKLLSYKDCAAELGVSVETVKKCVKKGLFPVVRFTKRLVKIDADKLLQFIEAGGVAATKSA